MAIFTGGKGRDDTFIGTDADDRFLFDPANLTSGDTIVGGGGLDTLAFTAAGVISVEALGHVSGVERIELSDLGNDITLSQALVDETTGHVLTVVGGAAADRIDASQLQAYSFYGDRVALLGGGGDDILIGGSDRRTFLDGGAGRDVMTLANGTVVYDAADRSITAMTDQATLAIASGMTVYLTESGDQTIGDDAVVTGFFNVDASASRGAVTLIGRGYGRLVGGDGNDTITGGDDLTGGKGRDTISGGGIFHIGEGDFARGESLTAQTIFSTLDVTGSVDFRTGTVTGMTNVFLTAGSEMVTSVQFFTKQLQRVTLLRTSGAEEGKTFAIDVYMGKQHKFASLSENNYDSYTLHGTEGADQITVTRMEVFAGAGDDSVRADGTVHAEDGDDRVSASIYGDSGSPSYKIIDGGTGIDTLVVTNTQFSDDALVFNLAEGKDQTTNDAVTVHGFENLDLSAIYQVRSAEVSGSKRANHIIGGTRNDVITGGGGDDVLDGFGGADRLGGGAGDDVIYARGAGVLGGGLGHDTFIYLGKVDQPDVLTDFHTADDTLTFSSSAFSVHGGAFDTVLVAANPQVEIGDSDLVLYTGGTFASAADVAVFLRQSGGGTAGNGLFVAGRDGEGHTALFYVDDASRAAEGNIHLLAELSGVRDPASLALSDFAFI